MKVRVRPKRPESILRRRREDRRGHALERATREPEASASPAPRPAASAPGNSREQRERGPLQDHAVYSCGCGYVFEAAVSTTVGCPHCGGTQAW